MAVNITRVGIVEEAFAANKIEAVATSIDKVTIVRNLQMSSYNLLVEKSALDYLFHCYSRELTSVEVVD